MFHRILIPALAILTHGSAISISSNPPANATGSPLEGFVSYSLEFAFFPDFAGNASSPNTFIDNLLNNIGDFSGTKPYIRVGGNTQDYALYNATLPYAVNGSYDTAKSKDYPTTVHIGPSFFESYNTWPNTKFTHGFNMGLGGNSSAGWESLLAEVPLVCKALSQGNLLAWEYGNEPDLFSTSAQGPVRPPTWNDSTYVSQWLNGTRNIKTVLDETCPGLSSYGYYSPSFAGVYNTLSADASFDLGLDDDGDIKFVSIHNYIGGATQPGITLQNTLLNHTATTNSIAAHVTLIRNLTASGVTTPYILGETNSLYNEGAPGLSNAFGAALWGVDFNLYSASVNIQRVHMHQGTNFRYASFQPIETNITSIGTKAPYYGNIAVAAFLGNLTDANAAVKVANIPLESVYEAAYASYVNDSLAKIAVINLRQYNYTVNGTSDVVNPVPRPSHTYSFQVGDTSGFGNVSVRRLYANGSDAITGITWDGYSYNYELDNGRPVRLDNVTVGETVAVVNGTVQVAVLDSTAVLLEF